MIVCCGRADTDTHTNANVNVTTAVAIGTPDADESVKNIFIFPAKKIGIRSVNVSTCLSTLSIDFSHVTNNN